jgi:hypothetical protein
LSAVSRVLFTSDEEERSLRVPAQSEAMGSNLLLTVAGIVDPGQYRSLVLLGSGTGSSATTSTPSSSAVSLYLGCGEDCAPVLEKVEKHRNTILIRS